METYQFNGVMTALSSITHNGGQSMGTTAKLRREKRIQPDGSVEEVPVISGNGIRGRLRDVGMLHMVRQLGYGEQGQGLSLPAFHFLFSGGSLTSAGGKAIQISEARRIKELIPLVGVFGGAMGNMILPGVLKCGKAELICLENRHLLPKEFEAVTGSCWDYVQEEMYTRRDDSKDDRKRELLSEDLRKLLDQDDAAKQKKSEKQQPVEKNDGATQQMMYQVESIAAGARFHWKVVLDDPTPLEFEAFLTTLAEFGKMPYLGGRSGTGMGEVSISFKNWIKLDSRAAVMGQEVGAPLGHLYAKHLADNGKLIRSVLESVK